MDLTEAGKPPAQTVTRLHSLEQELCFSYACAQTDSDGAISLQVLEFKSQLLEAVEELHIRRDAEGRFEEQISKLVLEKQELEWQKESLQHHIETLSSQQAESITTLKKQFEAKIRLLEEEKGKHKLFADSKEKELSSLIEELKLLQLSKYSLEKKSSELEQKLALKCRSKDNHLSQLGEVEKRFGALSKQCAMIKLAHETLEQNVDEAIRGNRKLTSAKEKLESTVVALKRELEELNNRQMKAKVSAIPHSEASSLSNKEQQIQQLQQKLLTETEMIKKLLEENASERAGKQEYMRSLQQAQQLLLNQTQALRKVEIELQRRRQEHQALKREHDVMRGKSDALEDRVAQLTEDCTSSRTRWETERKAFLEHASSEQFRLQAMTEAYDQLHQKHSELSSQVILHAQVQERGLKNPTKGSHSVMTENTLSSSENNLEIPIEDSVMMNTEDLTIEYEPNEHNHNMTERNIDFQLTAPSQVISDFTTQTSRIGDCCHSVMRASEVGSPSEFNPRCELPSLGSLQGSVPFLTRDCLVVAEEATEKLSPAGGITGRDGSRSRESSGYIEPQIPSTLLLSEAERAQVDDVDTNAPDPNTGERAPKPVSDPTGDDVSADVIGPTASAPSSMYASDAPAEWERDGGETSVSGREEGGVMDGAMGGGEVCREAWRDGGIFGTSGSGTNDGAEPGERVREAEAGTGGGQTYRGGLCPARSPEAQRPLQTSAESVGLDAAAVGAPRCDNTPGGGEPRPNPSPDESHCLHTPSGGVTGTDGGPVRAGRGVDTLARVQSPSNDAQPLTYVSPSVDDSVGKASLCGLTLESPMRPRVVCAVTPSDSGLKTHVSDVTDTQSKHLGAPSGVTAETEEQIASRGCEEEIKAHAVPSSQKTSELEIGLPASMMADLTPYKQTDALLQIDLFVTDAGPVQPVCEAERSVAGKPGEPCVDATVTSVGLGGPEASYLPGWDSGEGLSTPVAFIAGSSDAADPEDKAAINEALSKHTVPPLCQEKEALSERCRSKTDSGQGKLLGDVDYTASVCHKKHVSSLELALTQRKKDFDKSEISCTIPAFLRAKQNRANMVIIRASDLLSASSVSRPPSSVKRDQLGEWKAIGDTFKETTAEVPVSRAYLPAISPPVSNSSGAVCRLPLLTSSSFGKTPEPEPYQSPGSSSGSEQCISSSQENEEQQSSFRAEISKIQQFLCSDRLSLSKRQRTDN